MDAFQQKDLEDLHDLPYAELLGENVTVDEFVVFRDQLRCYLLLADSLELDDSLFENYFTNHCTNRIHIRRRAEVPTWTKRFNRSVR